LGRGSERRLEEQRRERRQHDDGEIGPGEEHGRENVLAETSDGGPEDRRGDAVRQHPGDGAALEGELGGIGGGEAIILRRGLEAAHQRVADAEKDEAPMEDGDGRERAAAAADQRAQHEAGAAAEARHQERGGMSCSPSTV
jgi:hypothetical protein